MKKLILALALVVLPMVCNAQLNVRGKGSKVETIASARTGFCKLVKFGEEFETWMPTSNQFDKTFILHLGENAESALATLEDLMTLSGNIDEPIYIDNGGKQCSISKGELGTLYFSQTGYAGLAALSKMEIKKFLKAMKEYNE